MAKKKRKKQKQKQNRKKGDGKIAITIRVSKSHLKDIRNAQAIYEKMSSGDDEFWDNVLIRPVFDYAMMLYNRWHLLYVRDAVATDEASTLAWGEAFKAVNQNFQMLVDGAFKAQDVGIKMVREQQK